MKKSIKNLAIKTVKSIKTIKGGNSIQDNATGSHSLMR